MNNKKIGTAFEKEFCEYLSTKGYWVHFLSPSENGSQPFDVIAVKNGKAHALDCKTSSIHRFSISRLEDNQILAFEKWKRCGNNEPFIAVKYNKVVYLVPYELLKSSKVVNLNFMRGLYECKR